MRGMFTSTPLRYVETVLSTRACSHGKLMKSREESWNERLGLEKRDLNEVVRKIVQGEEV